MTILDTRPAVEHGDPIAAAETSVHDARATLRQWEARLEDTRADLDDLESADGSGLLDDPESVDEIAARTVRLQASVRMLEKAITAQQSRVLVAESRYLAAQAEAHESAVADARAALEAHDAKTRRLLDAVERHEGPCMLRSEHIQAMSTAVAWDGGSVSWKEPKRNPLARTLYQARLHVAVLREMAAGRDPGDLFTQQEWRIPPSVFADNQRVQRYPDCVGPQALVPARTYVAQVQRQRERIVELETLASKLPGEIADMERQVAQGNWPGGVVPAGVSQSAINRRCARLEALDDELVEARHALAAITDG